jgi:chromate transporter
MGGLMTTWTTFLPSFLWILLGAPHVEKLRENKFLKDAMVCITASVVGVILNLAVWLGLHVLFPTHQPVNALGIAIFIVSWFALTYGKLGVLPVVALAGILGGATKLFLAS